MNVTHPEAVGGLNLDGRVLSQEAGQDGSLGIAQGVKTPLVANEPDGTGLGSEIDVPFGSTVHEVGRLG